MVPRFALALSALLLLVLTHGSPARPEVQLIVGIDAAAKPAVITQLAALARRGVTAFDSMPYVAITVDARHVDRVAAIAGVTSVSVDEPLRPALIDSTAMIGATDAWAHDITGANWNIAFIDTGIEKTHPMFAGRVVSEACYTTTGVCPGGTTESTAAGSGEPCAEGGCGHGTMVAGAAAGKSSTLSGVAPSAGIISIRVYEMTGGSLEASSASIIKGIERVLALKDAGMRIAAVNMSLHGTSLFNATCDDHMPAMTTAFRTLAEAGIAPVVSAGQSVSSAGTGIAFPACISWAVSVGAVTKSDAVASSSHSGVPLRLLAPGESIYTSKTGNTYGFNTASDSTSIAAAHVSGAFALLRQVNPVPGSEALDARLRDTGVQVVDPRNGLSRPRIRLDRALREFFGTPQFFSPAPGSALPGPTVTFKWAHNIPDPARTEKYHYFLFLGSMQGGYDLYNQEVGTARQVTVSGLPADGRTIYATLYYKPESGGVYHENTKATFIAGSTTIQPAELTAPAPSSTLTRTDAQFTWTAGVNATGYHLYVGTTPGGHDLHDRAYQAGQTSNNVAGLPADGRTIYATLWTRIGAGWYTRSYQYIAADFARRMVFPADGSTLPSTTVTFQWDNPPLPADGVHLYVGTTPGGYDIYDRPVFICCEQQVTGLPADGRRIYARLWTKLNGVFRYRDYSYLAPTVTAGEAEIITPTGGTTLNASTTFTWSAGTNVSEYFLYVGSSPGGYDLYSASTGTQRSAVVSIPVDGRGIYVTLWSRIAGAWRTRGYSYTAPNWLPKMTSPIPGRTLVGTTTTFTWQPQVFTGDHHLYVGTTPGGFDIYDRYVGAARSATVSGIPTNSKPVYVTLWVRHNGRWYQTRYTYWAQ